MKKRSKPGKQMRETIGIDLGDKVSRYCIVDQDGEVVEEGSFRNQTSSIEKHFGGEPRRVALEAGAQSAWISRELKRLGHEVIVANPGELKWITSSDIQNDPVDARKLALLSRADVRLLAPVEHRSAEQQAELAVIRGRDAMPGAHVVDQQCAQHRQGVRCEPAQVDHPHLRRASRRRAAGVSALGAHGVTGTDRRHQPGDRRLGSADRRVSREASGTGAARKYSRRRPAHRDDVGAHTGTRRAICTQPRCRGVPGAAAEAAAERRATRSGGFPRAVIHICASCWCSAPTIFWVIPAKTRPSGNGAWPRARAARKRPSGRSSRWPASYPCCCTAYG